MDPMSSLYERLRQLSDSPDVPGEPPSLEDWLRYWNDEDTDLVNIRNFEHWLARSNRPAEGHSQGRDFHNV